MGLSIHYKGSLKEASKLTFLIEEVQDIARANNWDYFIFENNLGNNLFSENIDDENLYGIMVTPPKSEPLCFTFLNTGKMCGIFNFNVLRLDSSIDDNQLYSVATKTQYAGFEIHKKIIHLLEHINNSYLIDFECIDEGKYWETKDEYLLIDTFNKYDNLVDRFSSALEMIPKNENETLEDYMIRMAEIIQKKQ